jgi:cytochrome oxidase Cu insertion factor (SCO1/SenC/PrrC family)
MPVGSQPGDLGAALLHALVVQGAVVLAFAVLGAALRPVVLARWGRGDQATPPEPRPRQLLRLALGALWILDGLLQAQPAMPSGFLPTMISPALSGQPSWLTSAAAPLVRAWAHHPVGADAVTVWVQLGLGLLIIVGGSGRLARAVLWSALGWSAVVWVIGEGLGGLLVPGASWLSGAPGAVVFYAIATALLLAPTSWWAAEARSGREAKVRKVARWSAGGAMLLGALLQALPWEGSWSAHGLSGIFRDASTTPQPDVLARPITGLAAVSTDHPAVVGTLLLVVLTVLGGGLLSGRAQHFFVPAALGFTAMTWWLGEDFGVLGGTGTDPNSAVPIAVLLLLSLPERARRPVPAGATRQPRPTVRGAAWGAGVAAVLVVPLSLGIGLLGPADAQAAVADDGGIRLLDGRAAPDFALTDQDGQPISLSGLRGNLVLLTFLDPVCSDNCPLIANQLAAADRAAATGRHVQIVAIDTNPLFHGRADVLTFTREHGLSTLANWHFVTGSVAQLGAALGSYGITVTVPDVGMVSHSQIVYFITPTGAEVSSMDDSAAADLTTGYVTLLTREIRARAP